MGDPEGSPKPPRLIDDGGAGTPQTLPGAEIRRLSVK